jgi:hypothetical protein
MYSRSSAAATMTFATSPYARAQASARSGVHGMPEELLQGGQHASPNRGCSVQSPPRSDGDHGPVAEEGHHVVELVDVSRPQGTGRPPACRAAPPSGSKHRAQLSVPQKQVRIESTAGHRRRRPRPSPTSLPGGGSHQAHGDRDSTMSGSVEATTAIALMMMSSGTPASRMAATRCPATAAKSSWLIPRPAWAWSSGRPS